MQDSIVATLALATLALTGCASAGQCPDKIPTVHRPGWERQLDGRITDLSGRERVRVLVFGDTGTKRHFERVGQEIARVCRQQGCDLGMMLGDNFYIGLFRLGPRESDSRHFDSVFYRPLAGLGDGSDVWPILGNHGYKGCPQAQIDHTYLGPRPGKPDWLMPAHAYAIPKLPAWLHIYAIDTEFVLDSKHFPGSEQEHTRARDRHLEGIEQALGGKQGWRILVGHHPLYTTGHHAEDDELEVLRRLLEPRIAELGVQLYLSGHDHDQELLRKGSLIQVVQGSGSRLRSQEIEPPDPIPGDATSVGFWKRRGFAIATFERDSLELEYFILDADKKVEKTEKWSWRRSELEN